ncbi:hypothetical protein CXR34_08175 [Microbacterium hominis]|uniref:Uncharacterized protein n=2 Tax=Microbacteriaceae TaxID=85023 RepID=A0A2K9DBF2_9MICO|nr:hypothetical protein CXR34_08175 [Microbacterium hominis]
MGTMISFFDAPQSSPMVVVALILGSAAAIAFIVATVRFPEGARRGGKAVVILGGLVLVLLSAVTTASIGLSEERQTRAENYRSQIEDVYGTQLTVQQVRELGFPMDEPSKPASYSTISVIVGEGAHATSQDIRLIWDGGAFRLLTRLPSNNWVDLASVKS